MIRLPVTRRRIITVVKPSAAVPLIFCTREMTVKMIAMTSMSPPMSVMQ